MSETVSSGKPKEDSRRGWNPDSASESKTKTVKKSGWWLLGAVKKIWWALGDILWSAGNVVKWWRETTKWVAKVWAFAYLLSYPAELVAVMIANPVIWLTALWALWVGALFPKIREWIKRTGRKLMWAFNRTWWKLNPWENFAKVGNEIWKALWVSYSTNDDGYIDIAKWQDYKWTDAQFKALQAEVDKANAEIKKLKEEKEWKNPWKAPDDEKSPDGEGENKNKKEEEKKNKTEKKEDKNITNKDVEKLIKWLGNIKDKIDNEYNHNIAPVHRISIHNSSSINHISDPTKIWNMSARLNEFSNLIGNIKNEILDEKNSPKWKLRKWKSYSIKEFELERIMQELQWNIIDIQKIWWNKVFIKSMINEYKNILSLLQPFINVSEFNVKDETEKLNRNNILEQQKAEIKKLENIEKYQKLVDNVEKKQEEAKKISKNFREVSDKIYDELATPNSGAVIWYWRWTSWFTACPITTNPTYWTTSATDKNKIINWLQKIKKMMKEFEDDILWNVDKVKEIGFYKELKYIYEEKISDLSSDDNLKWVLWFIMEEHQDKIKELIKAKNKLNSSEKPEWYDEIYDMAT